MPYGCIRAYHDPCGTVALACVTLAHAQCDMANRKAKWVRESVSLTLFSFGEPQPLATMGAMISRCCRDDDGVESDPLREPLEPAQLSGPCRAFRLNTKATAFGECLCGWPKADHTAAALCERGGLHNASRSRADTAWMQTQAKEVAICEVYRPDIRAAFGECVCGRARAEHSEEALRASTSRDVMGVRTSTHGPTPISAAVYCGDDASTSHSLGGARAGAPTDYCACDRFRPNLHANAFGVCVCGYARAEHSAEALKAAALSPRGTLGGCREAV